METGTITLKDPVKPGYTFGGWYKDGEFTTQVTEIIQGTTGNITLYAKWELACRLQCGDRDHNLKSSYER